MVRSFFFHGFLALFVTISSSSAQDQAVPGRTVFEREYTTSGLLLLPKTKEELIRRITREQFGRFVRVPFGRSPEKSHTNVFYPRELFSSGDEFTSTFVGHTPLLNELEIISWNPTDLRFEFLLVTDFGHADRSPKISYPNRADCTACHQNQGPHLSRFPWSETDFNRELAPLLFFAEKHRKTLESDGFPTADPVWTNIRQPDQIRAKILAWYDARPSLRTLKDRGHASLFNDLEGSDFGKFNSNDPSNSGVFSFDLDVRRANNRLRTVEMCRQVGKESEANRAQLIAILLDFAGSENQEDLPVFAGIHANWESVVFRDSHFARASSVLPDRDPLAETVKFFRPYQVESGVSKLKLEHLVSEAQLRKDIEKTTFLELERQNFTLSDVPVYFRDVLVPDSHPSADILRRRPSVGGFYPGDSLSIMRTELPHCFGLTPEDLVILQKVSPLVRHEIATKSKEFQLLAKSEHWPVSREEIMTAFRSAHRDLRLKDLDVAYDCVECSGPTETRQPLDASLQKQVDAILNRLDPTPTSSQTGLSETTGLALIEKTCADCHGKPDSKRKLPLKDLPALRTFRGKSGEKVSDYLSDRRMPPEDHSAQLTEQERKQLIEILRETVNK